MKKRMYKKSFCVIIVLVCCLCLMISGTMSVSANTLIGEDGSAFEWVLPVDSLLFESPSSGILCEFGDSISRFVLPQGDATASASQLQRSSSDTSSAGGTLASDAYFYRSSETSQVRWTYNGAGEYMTMRFSPVAITQEQLDSLRDSHLTLEFDDEIVGSITYSVTYAYQYTTYGNASYRWKTATREYTYPLEAGFNYTVALFPNASSLPIYSTNQVSTTSTETYYFIAEYSINIVLTSGHLRYMVMTLYDVPFVESASRDTIADAVIDGYYPDIIGTDIGGDTELNEAWTMLFAPIDHFLSIEIAPNVTIGGIFTALIAVPFIIAFLKFFAGG